jgi:mannose-6-phosphate isomerase-like protein (cupin superfamily)
MTEAASDSSVFYDGQGFSNIGGPDLQRALDVDDWLQNVKSDVSLVGNIFEPVLTADFPGCPTGMAMNYLALPDRRLEHVLIRVTPGHMVPRHFHAYGDEAYLVVRGRGQVELAQQ